MKKIEQVFREILYQAIEKNNQVLKQSELAKKLGFSLSTINLAVKKLERMNAVKISKMNFRVINQKKILYLWASIRNPEKDITYKTRVEMPVKEIEKNLPDKPFRKKTKENKQKNFYVQSTGQKPAVSPFLESHLPSPQHTPFLAEGQSAGQLLQSSP